MKKIFTILAAAAVAAPASLCQVHVSGNHLGHSIGSLTASSAEIAVENPFNSGSQIHYAVDKGHDIFSTSKVESIFSWFADNYWMQVADPTVTLTGDNSLELNIIEGSGQDQWQGQVNFSTTLGFSASKYYDFVFDLESDAAIDNLTFQVGSDDSSVHVLSEKQKNPFNSSDENKVRCFFPNFPGKDIANAKVTFDFTNTSAGQKINISNIRFIEHDKVMFEDEELIGPNILADATPEFEIYIQDENYLQIPDAASAEYSDGTATITALKDGSDDLFRNTVRLSFPGIEASSSKLYYSYEITSSVDLETQFHVLYANKPLLITSGPSPWVPNFIWIHMNKFRQGQTLKISSIDVRQKAAIYKNTTPAGDNSKISLDGLASDTEYVCRLQALDSNGSAYSAPEYAIFRTEDPAGIENVAVDAAGDAEWYTTQGIRVANPSPGNIYIRVNQGKCAKIRY